MPSTHWNRNVASDPPLSASLAFGEVPQRVRVDAAGRVVIPVGVRKALGISKGQELTLALAEDRITLSTLERARARVKAIARTHCKDDGSVVDAFLAARRADAKGEP